MTSSEVRVERAAPLRAGACHVVAEAGANHNNSVDRAIEMARRAADAGAWGVKYQLYKADSIAVRESPKYWTDDIGTRSQYEAFELSDRLDYGDYAKVADACLELGIVFFATPFDIQAVEALESMGAPVYKVASGDITHRALLEAVAATGKPVFLSTGASTEEEIWQAIDWIGYGPEKLVPLVCTLTYPTPDEDGHFARIERFREVFAPYLIGMSDHTIGPEGGWMAAALGAVCIEKHYTVDKKLPDVPDHSISVDPDELTDLVRACNRGAVLRGTPTIEVHESERPARENARRSIVLERDVLAGHVLGADDLGFKRPGIGIPPFQADRVLGRRVKVDLPRGTILQPDDLEAA